MDTPRPAELTWSALATADSAAPTFDGVTCAGAYCHGPTLMSGGTNTTPTWARVDGTQAACGTCHGRPPGGTHPTETNCSICHSATALGRRASRPRPRAWMGRSRASTSASARTPSTSRRPRCTPPGTARSATGRPRRPRRCPSGTSTATRAEAVFGPILGAGTTYSFTTGVCGSTYCHGNGNVRAAAPGYRCSQCHAASVSSTGALLRVDQHVNGIVEVSVPSFNPALCGGRGGCTPAGCHGTQCW